MADDLARLLAETYRWQRRLGNQVIATPHCSIVANPAHPAYLNEMLAEPFQTFTFSPVGAP
jgi:hypothetical protein